LIIWHKTKYKSKFRKQNNNNNNNNTILDWNNSVWFITIGQLQIAIKHFDNLGEVHSGLWAIHRHENIRNTAIQPYFCRKIQRQIKPFVRSLGQRVSTMLIKHILCMLSAYTYWYVRTHSRTQTAPQVYIYIYVCVCVFCLFIYTYVYVYIQFHIFMFLCIIQCVFLCMRVRACVCAYLCV